MFMRALYESAEPVVNSPALHENDDLVVEDPRDLDLAPIPAPFRREPAFGNR